MPEFFWPHTRSPAILQAHCPPQEFIVYCVPRTVISSASSFKTHNLPAICRALGRMDLITDERFSSAAKRFAAMDVLLEILEAQTRDRRTADLLDVLWAESDVAIAPVNSIEDFLDNPQVRHNRTVFTLDDADAGPIRQLAPFTKFAESDTAQFTPCAETGRTHR